MNIDQNARYLASHEWVRLEGGVYVCGISDHAQDALGDVVYVDLPAVGSVFKKGEVFGVIESVKSASDLYLPVGGTVVAVNELLEKGPDLVNRAPYGDGWLIKIEASDAAEWDLLLTPESYGALP